MFLDLWVFEQTKKKERVNGDKMDFFPNDYKNKLVRNSVEDKKQDVVFKSAQVR